MSSKRRALLSTLAAAALAVAGCGGNEGGDDLSRGELAKKANEICAKYSEEGRKLEAPSDINDPQQAADYFGEANDIAQRQQDDLEALRPAENVKADYDRFTKATGDATKLLGDLAAAAEAKDASRSSELVRKLQPASTAVDEASNAVGAGNCAS